MYADAILIKHIFTTWLCWNDHAYRHWPIAGCVDYGILERRFSRHKISTDNAIKGIFYILN